MRTHFKCLAEFRYGLNLDVFAPFNFHKLEAVRKSYNELILLVLGSGSITDKNDLKLLLTLTIQSIVTESNIDLLSVLYKSLEQLVKLVPADDFKLYIEEYLMEDKRLPEWMDCHQPDFSSFMFLQSVGFQSIHNDYFNIVFRPSNDAEWEVFNNLKVKKLTYAVALMLRKGKCTN